MSSEPCRQASRMSFYDELVQRELQKIRQYECHLRKHYALLKHVILQREMEQRRLAQLVLSEAQPTVSSTSDSV